MIPCRTGYTTGHIGKWHLGDEGFLPQDQGFDYNYAGTRSGMPRSFFFPQWTGNPPVEAEKGEYLPDHLTDHALEFIESNQDKPFFHSGEFRPPLSDMKKMIVLPAIPSSSSLSIKRPMFSSTL